MKNNLTCNGILFLYLAASSIVVCLDETPLNTSDYFSKLNSHFHSVFGEDDELLANSKQKNSSVPSAGNGDEKAKNAKSQKSLTTSRKLLESSKVNNQANSKSKNHKRKLRLEDEVNSLLGLINKAAFGAIPGRKNGRETVQSTTKITNRKDSETISKFTRQAKTNRYVNSDANSINKISQHVINLNEDEVTKFKDPSRQAPSKKKSTGKVVVKKILHNDLTNRENDYSQLIINSYTTKDWDNYTLDLKKSIYHQKLNEAVSKITENTELEDIDLDKITVTQDDVLNYLQKATGLTEQTLSSNQIEGSLTQKRKALVQELLDLLTVHPSLLMEFNPQTAEKVKCDPALVGTLDNLLKQLSQKPDQQKTKAEPIKSEMFKEVSVSTNKTAIHSKKSIHRTEKPPALPSPVNSNSFPSQFEQPPILPESLNLNPTSYQIPGAPFLIPGTSPFMYGLPPSPLMGVVQQPFPPMMAQSYPSNPNEPNIDFYYHYFPAHYVKNLATKKYLSELNSMIKKIPISSDNPELQKDVLHEDPTDEMIKNAKIQTDTIDLGDVKPVLPGIVKSAESELSEESNSEVNLPLHQQYPVLQGISEASRPTHDAIIKALGMAEENRRKQEETKKLDENRISVN